MNTINLFDIVSEIGVHGAFHLCRDHKEYEVEHNGYMVRFVAPSTPTNKIVVSHFSHFNVKYYSIVVGLLFDNDIMMIDNIVVGTETVPRANIWKVYEIFENTTKEVMKLIDVRFKNEPSKWDSLVEMLKMSDDEVDHWDIAEMVSPTFKSILEAELADRKLVKTRVTQKLF